MADLIDRKAALDALQKIPYWNPEDRYRARKAVEDVEACLPTQSADEMFQTLGYEKKDDTYLWIEYVDNDGFRILLKFPGGRHSRNMMVLATNPVTGACELNTDEILACAQLIREMEAAENV